MYMTLKVRPSSSFSCLTTLLSSPLKVTRSCQPAVLNRRYDGLQLGTQKLINVEVNSFHFISKLLKLKGTNSRKKYVLLATLEDQSQNRELKPDMLDQAGSDPGAEALNAATNSFSNNFQEADGRPGLVSFYSRPYKIEDEAVISDVRKNQSSVLWYIGPSILVASFIFPLPYLRKILSTIFEDSLLTDFLILFFTEALFYCGVAIFLLLVDHIRRPLQQEYATNDVQASSPQLGERISSVAALVLSLMITMVTMGLVWPWTGPAASATLAPYLVGIVVQFAFEQYAKYWKSPSLPVIPVIFQVYRLHQLNRAAELVTALSNELSQLGDK